MRRFLLRIIGAAAVLYVAIVALAYFNQRSFLYHPDTKRYTPSEAGLDDFQEIAVNGPEATLVSWWRPPAEPDGPVIIAFHGNGGALADRADHYAEIAGKDVGLLTVGYPGYGGNTGKPSEDAFFRTALANYDWLIGKGYKSQNIVILGQSMGTGVAVWLAEKRPSAGLVLQSPYTSIVDMAAIQMPYIPAKLLLKDRFDSLSRISRINVPIGWIHSRKDELIPFAMGEKLFAAALSRKCKLALNEGGHNDMNSFAVADFARRNAKAMVRDKNCSR
jgi:fermentation-respiration switch protein FrsA (DUF1100 family)